jgi:hypothetical protein
LGGEEPVFERHGFERPTACRSRRGHRAVASDP